MMDNAEPMDDAEIKAAEFEAEAKAKPKELHATPQTVVVEAALKRDDLRTAVAELLRIVTQQHWKITELENKQREQQFAIYKLDGRR